jgi:hypothetical protein
MVLMKDFSDLIKQRLSQKKLAKLSIGAFVIQLLRQEATAQEEIDGYVKNQIVFVSLSDRADKTSWYLRK